MVQAPKHVLGFLENMKSMAAPMDLNETLERVETAAQEGKLSAGAVVNLSAWLTEPRYAEYAPLIVQEVAQGNWKKLDDLFWTVIPFGTGGRRGRMAPFGSNAINDRTIGESAQGLADYVKDQGGRGELSCAIAYDTRINSRRFAELCAGIMVANGFRVFFLDEFRSTPELSFLVRFKKCSCGIMVTASHNPPSDNAVKVYWSTGGQVLPPHDAGIIERVANVQEIRRADFAQAAREGKIIFCNEEVDAAFVREVKAQGFAGPRDVKVLYSPLHGVGRWAAVPALEADGFREVEVFAAHAAPDGNFPNVPGHVSNPENPEVVRMMFPRAHQIGADLVLASDPDCDRLGAAAPLTTNPKAEWGVFTGNQIGVLLGDYILEQRRKARTLLPEHYVVTTLVTSEMLRRVADSYGVKTDWNNLVGFKWIAGRIDELGPELFLYGAEESHGYMAGTYTRDKDGAVASMLMAELAALVKSQRKSLHEKLESLFWQHGYHAEQQFNLRMEGSEGMAQMQKLMDRFRNEPPPSLAGIPIIAMRDYLRQVTIRGGKEEKLSGPKDNLIFFDLAEPGNRAGVRPSGTEPKVKFYLFTYRPAELLHDLDQTREEMQVRLNTIERELLAFAGA
jgi:phosphoglucomutase/phosphomannomutase